MGFLSLRTLSNPTLGSSFPLCCGTMTLQELEMHEQVALVALLGLLARLDSQASSGELELLKRVASEIGLDRFEQVANEAAELPDGQAILDAAVTVTRPEAREIIYELVYDMAINETVVEEEDKLLEHLATVWQLPRRARESESESESESE
jgi:hypothetical protein